MRIKGRCCIIELHHKKNNITSNRVSRIHEDNTLESMFHVRMNEDYAELLNYPQYILDNFRQFIRLFLMFCIQYNRKLQPHEIFLPLKGRNTMGIFLALGGISFQPNNRIDC